VKDKTCSRSLEKFSRSLKDALQKLAAGEDGADTSAVFDSPAVDADSRTDATHQVCKLEIFIGPVPTYYLAIRLQIHFTHHPGPDVFLD